MSPVELRRIIAEWRLRVSRVKNILQPPSWSEKEWRQFAQALALLVRDHGRSWIIDPNVYWDLRWKLQDGGELVCQVEHIPSEKTSLIVAQTGGFAVEVGSYTWLWAEFNMAGDFARDPYWVEGTWKEALTTLLLPLDRQSSYLLAGRTDTPTALLNQEGARPNEGYFNLSLTEGERGRNGSSMPEQHEEFHPGENGAQEESQPAAWDGGAVTESTEEAAESLETVAAQNGNHEAASVVLEPVTVPWERSAKPPDGRDGRFRRRRARLLQSRHARTAAPRSYRHEIQVIVTMD